MHQPPAERRLAGHVARQSPAGRIEAGGHFHLVALLLGHGRPQGEHPREHVAAIPVNVASRGADLGIGVAGQRFLNEIDEAGLALQAAQERDGLAACGRLWYGRGRLLRCGAGAGSAAGAAPASICATCSATAARNRVRKKTWNAKRIRRMIGFRRTEMGKDVSNLSSG